MATEGVKGLTVAYLVQEGDPLVPLLEGDQGVWGTESPPVGSMGKAPVGDLVRDEVPRS